MAEDFGRSSGGGETRKLKNKETKMIDEILKIQSPWIRAQSKLKALFGEDPDIRIEMDERKPSVTLYVGDAAKADALAIILPDRCTFGNVTMAVTVKPANPGARTEFGGTGDVLAAAFKGNPVVKQLRPVSKGLFRNLTYCVFRNEVVQFFDDNLGDINGFCSTLMEDIADELLHNVDDVFFCTAAGEKLQAPLGEWP